MFPGRTEETYELPLTRVVYIEQTDFREKKSKDYYGLALDQPAMLKWGALMHACVVCCHYQVPHCLVMNVAY